MDELFITVPKTIDGAGEVAAKVLGEDDPITQSILIRQKKQKIAQEYRERRAKGEKKKDLLFDLAEKYNYSWQSIRLFVSEKSTKN